MTTLNLIHREINKQPNCNDSNEHKIFIKPSTNSIKRNHKSSNMYLAARNDDKCELAMAIQINIYYYSCQNSVIREFPFLDNIISVWISRCQIYPSPPTTTHIISSDLRDLLFNQALIWLHCGIQQRHHNLPGDRGHTTAMAAGHVQIELPSTILVRRFPLKLIPSFSESSLSFR